MLNKQFIHETTTLCVHGYIRSLQANYNNNKNTPSIIVYSIRNYCRNQLGMVINLKDSIFLQTESYPEYKLIISNSNLKDINVFKLGLSTNGCDLMYGINVNLTEKLHSIITDGKEGVVCKDGRSLGDSTEWMMYDADYDQIELIVRIWKTQTKIAFCLVRYCHASKSRSFNALLHAIYPCDECKQHITFHCDQIGTKYQLLLILQDEDAKKNKNIIIVKK